MKLVEECAGVGELTWRDRTLPAVAYSISRYQAMTAGGLPVPGLHRIEGRLTLDGVADPAEISGGSVALHLEDGRVLQLTVMGEDGTVLAEGHGPSKCMCC